MGLQVRVQRVEDGRANVLATWPGSGGGPTLMFNGHTDTSYSGREPWLAGIPLRVRLTDPATSTVYTHFQGSIDVIDPTPGVKKERRVTVVAFIASGRVTCRVTRSS